MAKITGEKLISQIKLLKEIKPREEWVVLAKSQIFVSPEKQKVIKIPAQKIGILDILSSVFFQKKLAYSLAAFVFIVLGLVGFAGSTVPGDALFPVKKMAEQSQAALSGQTIFKQNVATLTNRINDLALVTKEGKKSSISSAIDEVSINAKELTKNLKANPVEDSAALKEIAISLKTLADVPGTDLATNQDVKDLYQVVVQNQIDDLKKTTLTDEQKKTLAEAEDLYGQEKYNEALEKLLLINK